VTVLHLRWATQVAEQLLGEIELALEELVVVDGIVVGDDPLPRPGMPDQGAGVGERGVPPADLFEVFVVGVLGLVDEHVDAGEELDEPGMDGQQLTVPADLGG
jgi:hypothetical protein